MNEYRVSFALEVTQVSVMGFGVKYTHVMNSKSFKAVEDANRFMAELRKRLPELDLLNGVPMEESK